MKNKYKDKDKRAQISNTRQQQKIITFKIKN